MRNWLQQQLSQRLGAAQDRSDGLLANVSTPLPGALRWRILDALRVLEDPLARQPEDPWQLPRLTWTVLEVISSGGDGVDGRLRKVPTGGTLAARATAIAGLFDRYSVHRPAMVQRWISGDPVGGDGQPLDPPRRWQFDLFRVVHRHIADRHGVADSPAERLARAVSLLRSGDLMMAPSDRFGLPRRLFAFGLSTLSSETGPLLEALSVHRDVELLMVGPSCVAALAAASSVGAAGASIPARDVSWAFPRPAEVATPQHPLLVTWATRPLDAAVMLGAAGVPLGTASSVSVDPHHSETLLDRLQSDVRAGAVSPTPFTPAATDTSFQVHAAPGMSRQVEVLRDVILGLLRSEDGLRESDILVVCPQLESYAPVLSAVLGPSATRTDQLVEDQVPALRYNVVDRSARSFNPVLEAMAQTMSIVSGRFEMSVVRDLLALPAVRERFGLTPDDLGLLHTMAERAGVRWGLDGDHRGRWGIPSSYRANSWAAGIDQLMMGVAVGDSLRRAPVPGDELAVGVSTEFELAFGGIAALPLEDGDLVAAGRVAAALRSLERAHDVLVGGPPRPVAEWCTDLRTVADLMVAPAWREEWQREALDRAIDGLATCSADLGGTPSDLVLEFAEVRRLLGPSLDGPAALADLGFGSVVVASPSLTSYVPFRVVCILGLDADALPSGRKSGDDLLAQSLSVGDRDKRADVRADLLAAVLSARDHLVITCTSRNVRTNAAVPQAVVLEELLELVAATTGQSVENLSRGSAPLVRSHPRQSFAQSNFETTDGAVPFGFDPVSLAGARALQRAQVEPPPALTDDVLVRRMLPLNVAVDSPVDLSELRRFYDHPVRHFFRNRLNVVVPSRRERSDEGLPLALDGRNRAEIGRALYRVGLGLEGPSDTDGDQLEGPSGPLGRLWQSLLVALFGDPDAAGAEPWSADALRVLDDRPQLDEVAQVLQTFRARGAFPPDPVLEVELAELADEVASMLEAADGLGVRGPAGDHHAVDTTLSSGTRLVGMVTGCIGGPRPGPVSVSIARGAAARRLQVALDLLALTVSQPEVEWRSVYLARPETSKSKLVVEQQTVRGGSASERQANADAALSTLVEQFRDGSRIALPLFARTSFAFVNRSPSAAKTAWQTWARSPVDGEDVDPHHVRAFGELSYAQLCRLRVDRFSLKSEAERLWGTLGSTMSPGWSTKKGSL
jgi:exodeoxyribonuclease V gamma subunit